MRTTSLEPVTSNKLQVTTRKEKKSFLVRCFLSIVTCDLLLVSSVAFASKVELLYDNNFLGNAEILNLNRQDYVPLKAIAVLLKGKTQWYPIAGQVVLQAKNQRVQFNVDSRQVTLGNKKSNMSAPLRIIKNQSYAPLNFFLSQQFSDFFDCVLNLDSQKKTLHLKSRATLSFPRVFTRSNLTRILIESERKIQPELKKKDKTFLVEIPNARIAQEEDVSLKNSLVERLKLSPARPGALLKIELLKDVTNYSLFRRSGTESWILELQDIASFPEDAEKEAEDAFTPAPRSLQPIRKIVVDAGHGGHDSGAKGPRGTKEKEINLLLALELAEILSREGYEVMLTRSDDTFIPLHERTLFANQNKADLFISIHCNAMRKRRGVRAGTKSGFEIYFLSDKASDNHAEAAAEFENAVIDLEGPPTPQKQKLQKLLFSMARTEFINESSLLCHKIARAVEKRVPIENRGVKQANFHVLHGAQMPSVLVEAAFIDFPREEKKLQTKKFRSAIVEAIFAGVQDYEKHLDLLRKR